MERDEANNAPTGPVAQNTQNGLSFFGIMENPSIARGTEQKNSPWDSSRKGPEAISSEKVKRKAAPSGPEGLTGGKKGQDINKRFAAQEGSLVGLQH